MQLPDRQQLEAEFSRKLSRLNARQRKRLRELMGSPPDPSRVPPSFWDEVRRDTERELAALLFLIYASSARLHSIAGTRMSGIAAPAGLDAQLENQASSWAQARAAASAEKMAATARDAFAKKSRDILDRIERGDRVTQIDLNRDLQDVIGDAKAGRAATTETTVAQSAGGDAGIEATVGISLDDLWINRPSLSRSGPCEICKPLHMTRREQWETQFPGGPPAHENCVCEVRYANLQRKQAAA